ncbi:MAG TPA: hypothetical protein DDX37_03395 [Candidatus Omnitrophica bacterium]|nr:hypothetical protein [Candidatus Omnitrophota bacterium]
MMNITAINELIRKNKSFLVTTHVNPDPDGICSQLTFAQYLKSKGKKVFVINNEKMLARFHFLPGVKQIKHYQEGMIKKFDVAVVLDCGEPNRVGKVSRLIKDGVKVINIDHHITNSYFGDANLVDLKASSTSEIVFEYLKKVKFKLNKNIAIWLYSGIMTDTGSFRYENTTQRTHAITAELMHFKFSVTDIYRHLYEMVPIGDLQAFTQVVTRFDALFGGKVVCVELHKKVLSKFSDSFDLRDTIFKFLRAIKGVEVYVILTEIGRNKTRVNLRSSRKFDVARLANVFDGGGHKRASGCAIDKNIKDARTKIINQIKKSL